MLDLPPVADLARATVAAPAIAAARHCFKSAPPSLDPARAAAPDQIDIAQAAPARAAALDKINVAVCGADRRDGGGSEMAAGCLRVKRVVVWIEEMAVATA
jgi:hypothetical protein